VFIAQAGFLYSKIDVRGMYKNVNALRFFGQEFGTALRQTSQTTILKVRALYELHCPHGHWKREFETTEAISWFVKTGLSSYW